MNSRTFGEKLKQLREAAGLSQPELAKRAGMNRFGVAKLEQGVRQPTWDTVQALCKALGVTCTAFEAEGDAPAASASPTRPGRPRKATGSSEEEKPVTESKPAAKKTTTRRKKT